MFHDVSYLRGDRCRIVAMADELQLVERSSSRSSLARLPSSSSISREWSNHRLASQLLWCFLREGEFLWCEIEATV